MLNPTERIVVQAARDLIADESRWCRGSMALDVHGLSVLPMSDEARRWCAMGALERACITKLLATQYDDLAGLTDRLSAVATAVYGDTLAHHLVSGHGAVGLALVNDAIGRAAALVVFDKLLADETIEETST